MQGFWQTKTLEEMSHEEWDALCDGCGKCCLHKLQDEDDDQVYYTDVACRYLDLATARCSDYANRLHNVSACLNLRPADVRDFHWLPGSCSYRLLAYGQPLPSWHPLLSGDPSSVVSAGGSVVGRVVSEAALAEADLEERIVYWVEE